MQIWKGDFTFKTKYQFGSNDHEIVKTPSQSSFKIRKHYYGLRYDIIPKTIPETIFNFSFAWKWINLALVLKYKNYHRIKIIPL
jgi:hypothetical protein